MDIKNIFKKYANQIPKNPNVRGDKMVYCPVCGSPVVYEEPDEGYYQCLECGYAFYEDEIEDQLN